MCCKSTRHIIIQNAIGVCHQRTLKRDLCMQTVYQRGHGINTQKVQGALARVYNTADGQGEQQGKQTAR